MQRAIYSTDELGAIIRKERKALGLTQSDLAASCGFSLRFISELERGRATAGIGRVLHVLERLGLTVWIESPQSGSRC